MTRIVAALSALLSTLLVLTPIAAAAPPENVAVGGPTGQSRAEVLRYWTAARKATAMPREQALRSSTAKPRGGASYTITKVSDSERTSFPGRTNGKVYMTMGTTNYQCSGTAVTSTNKSTVLTAGHCVWDSATGYATNFIFIPAKSAASEPYGSWTATDVWTTGPWRDSQDLSFDLGAAKVAPTGPKALTDIVGGRGVAFNGPRDQAYTLYGYPAAGKYSGQYLYKCATRYAMDDPEPATSPTPIGTSCDWPGGTSGGAWIGANGNLASVTSFGYPNLKEYVFGPYLGSVAQSFYNDVKKN